MRTLTMAPAYGRDYKSAKAAEAAWTAGKDWSMTDVFLSGYVSVRDAEALKRNGIGSVKLRYNGLRYATVVQLG